MLIDARVLLAVLVLSTSRGAQRPAGGPVLRAQAASATVAIRGWTLGGRVRVIAWDRDSVVLRGSLARGEHLAFGGDERAIKFAVEDPDHGARKSDLTLYVPQRATVSLKSVSADISAQDVSGSFYSVSGNIRLAGTATSIEAESITGNLDFNLSVTTIRAQTGDGHVLVRGSPQDVVTTTVGGTISIATPTILRGQFSTVSGDIQYASALSAAGIFDLSTHSGEIDLALPRNTSASLTLSSITGPIENGFASVRPTSGQRSMRINLGRGDAQLSARTFKGAIRLHAQ